MTSLLLLKLEDNGRRGVEGALKKSGNRIFISLLSYFRLLFTLICEPGWETEEFIYISNLNCFDRYVFADTIETFPILTYLLLINPFPSQYKIDHEERGLPLCRIIYFIKIDEIFSMVQQLF